MFHVKHRAIERAQSGLGWALRRDEHLRSERVDGDLGSLERTPSAGDAALLPQSRVWTDGVGCFT